MVSINMHPADDALAAPYMNNKGLEFTSLRAPSTKWAIDTYNIKGAPANFLVDEQGRVIFRPVIRDDASVRTVELEIEALLGRLENKH